MEPRIIEPYITPKKLLGNHALPIKCVIAFICYCPMPSAFDRYDLNIEKKERYFLHTHNNHVRFCHANGSDFVVIAEVYGGPISTTTVEELHHYGVSTIIGIGFVGSLYERLLIILTSNFQLNVSGIVNECV